jgi:hypothetical protein
MLYGFPRFDYGSRPCPEYETEADYLARLGLLTPEEKAIGPAALRESEARCRYLVSNPTLDLER